ncbi:hypothetical protein [Microbacterium sp. 18062]|uniref:hypothetical protein n=1 Tax=Microbacterium sp. 18062 TaxID=2681410 RepID=UPI001356A4CB|nr:hypothetical protein [Microbacterium sp. 18062]
MSDPQSSSDAGTPGSNPETGEPLGDDGTIPQTRKGVSVGHSDDASNFNPEEDEDAPSEG